MHPLLAIALSYVLGSIPAAYIAGKSRGVDLRKVGSGNLGATNVVRTLGARIGAAVFLFDVAKGAVPTALFPQLASPVTAPGWWSSDPRLLLAIACGVAAIVGHVRPIFLKFGKGGKGVATSAGVFLGLAPVATAAALVTFLLVVLVSGYVSLGSLTAAVVLTLVLLVREGPSPLFVVSLALAAFVFWTHRANIGRLRRGEEHRFGKRAAKRGEGDAHGGKRGGGATGAALAVVIGAAVVVAVFLVGRLG